jgi:hypothetical protein
MLYDGTDELGEADEAREAPGTIPPGLGLDDDEDEEDEELC